MKHTLDTTGRTSSNSLGPVFTEEIGNSYHEEQETYFEEPLSVVLSSSPSSSSYIEQLESSRGAEQVIETPKLTGSENNDTDYTSAKLQQKVRSTSYGATVVKSHPLLTGV
ncbi:uncharacterized protein LOC143239390 isoform X2 [Tachypleus tridentatus]|uniref:uncharacterized protein LOC143239390 isoform X2 n=1 Tax=Tachypleus tridentatus TaxID=6853 RepID=UPI003FD1176B